MASRCPRDPGWPEHTRSRHRWGRVWALVAVAATAIATAACGGGDGGPARTQTDDGTLTVPPAADAAQATDAAGCRRPYSDDSPWNTPIPDAPKYLDRDIGIRGELTSSPEQYTYPVYYVSSATPRRAVTLSGWFSNVVDGGKRLVNQRAGTAELPIPDAAEAAAGSDAQIILIDPTTV